VIDGNATRIAAITGAANGIGRAIATRFAADGMHVLAIDREESAALEEDVRATGGKLRSYRADLGVSEEVLGVFDRIHADGYEIDILVNNVGRSAREKAKELAASDLSTLRPLLALNLECAILACRQVIEGMIAQGWGRIVNIASEAAVTGAPKNWDYAAAKAGLIGFTRSLANDVALNGVTVNAIAPGLIRTLAFEQVLPELRDQALARIPMKRPGTPEEIAHTAAFLASSGGSYITGQTLLVNGGSWYL
jgi:NAD(P)-dependent dehydrogenase (short-subunit alcohol dehydrogenase family)